MHKSGANDFDVFSAAMEQYEKAHPNRHTFPYVQPWLRLRDCSKWKNKKESDTSASTGSKRTRNEGQSSQSDGRTFIDINDEPIDHPDEQPLSRPVGRTKAKKAASSSNR
jgi:hypothetical protein